MVTVTFFPIFFENGEKRNCHHFAEGSAVPCRSVSQLNSYRDANSFQAAGLRKSSA
jgi:hypothetical protein